MAALNKDVEAAETEPLLKKSVLDKLETQTIGGTPGNPMFAVTLQLGVRTAVVSSLMGLLVWKKDHLGPFQVLEDYAEHMPLAICILIFTISPSFGTVLDNAGAAIMGVFIACMNIWVMRGFFPNGVEPGMGMWSVENVVGWVDVTLFNLIMLASDVKPGTRIFAMSQNIKFILGFLDPNNSTVFSKNFNINVNGAAIRALVGISMGAILAIFVMLIPYPWGFAYKSMRSNAQKASGDMSKMFMAAVNYCTGSSATVMIEKQMHQLDILRKEIDSLKETIEAAFHETFDVGMAGTVRGFMQSHSELMDELFHILHAMMMALEDERFDKTHTTVMSKIGGTSKELVTSAAALLICATNASHLHRTDDEKADLVKLEQDVKSATAKLASEFDKVRRTFPKALERDLLSLSSFVFTLSAAARKISEFSSMIRDDPPAGLSFTEAIVSNLKGKTKVTLPSLESVRFVIRYIVGLTACLIFSVLKDSYSPACAMTAVFLLNCAASPNLKGSLDVMLAIVVSNVVGALMFSWSCQTGHGDKLLPFAFFLYLVPTVSVAMGSSSFVNIGFFAAALSPFYMVDFCPAADEASSSAKAVSLWGGIRARTIAMFIITFCEFMFMEKRLSTLATDKLDYAMQGVLQALSDMWAGKNPDSALEAVPGLVSGAAEFDTGAQLEPRYNHCKWNRAFMSDCLDATTRLRTDVLLCYRGMAGLNGNTESISDTLKSAQGFKAIEDQLGSTLEDARGMSRELLLHESGEYTALKVFEGRSETGLDKLEGMDKAMDDLIAGGIKFPKAVPESMEGDQICQLCVVILTLEFAKQHMAAIVHSAIKNT
jgi:hypothetical protein